MDNGFLEELKSIYGDVYDKDFFRDKKSVGYLEDFRDSVLEYFFEFDFCDENSEFPLSEDWIGNALGYLSVKGSDAALIAHEKGNMHTEFVATYNAHVIMTCTCGVSIYFSKHGIDPDEFLIKGHTLFKKITENGFVFDLDTDNQLVSDLFLNVLIGSYLHTSSQLRKAQGADLT